MSRKPTLTLTEARQRVLHLEKHNAQMVVELRGCRDALRQQQRHIRQLVRALEPTTTRHQEQRA